MISRKQFIKQTSLFMAGGSLSAFGFPENQPQSGETLTILFTNDTHARLDPFPENAREFAGLGGISRRASLIKKLRYYADHVLLLDAGDVFQGTPWFDVYGGAVDFELMSNMGYDAMVPGNHEFDLGPDGFAEAARKAKFPFLAANYYTRNTAMHPFVKNDMVKEFAGLRVGIFGLGIPLEGVVNPDLQGGVRSFDTLRIAERSVNSLRNYRRCDYVICLSHLGFQYDSGRMDDHKLATSVKGIDLIIGGHTHTFLDEPVCIEHEESGKTWITQMGHSGVRLGRMDIALTDDAIQGNKISSRYYVIGE